MKHLLNETGVNLGNFGPLFYNNMISFPLLMFFAVILNEIPSLLNFNFSDQTGFFLFVALIVDGPFIAFSSFWCIKTTSATTYSVIGSLNKIPLSVLGELFFNQQMSFMGRIGVFVVVLGGIVYSFEKKEKKSEKKEIEKKEVNELV
jgi:GDP-mannose transporter